MPVVFVSNRPTAVMLVALFSTLYHYNAYYGFKVDLLLL